MTSDFPRMLDAELSPLVSRPGQILASWPTQIAKLFGHSGRLGCMLRALLFDFADTLFPAFREEAIRELLLGLNPSLDQTRFVTIMAEFLERSSSPEELAKRRDISAEAHRRCWTELLRSFDYFGPGTAELIYANFSNPVIRTPFPDTHSVLNELHQRNVPVGVVSDIGWDIRPLFDHYALGHLVRSWILSFEHGIEKPDARLFQLACRDLDVEPHETIMVGDSLQRDGGAIHAGLTALVLPKYQGHGDRGLRTVINMLG